MKKGTPLQLFSKILDHRCRKALNSFVFTIYKNQIDIQFFKIDIFFAEIVEMFCCVHFQIT